MHKVPSDLGLYDKKTNHDWIREADEDELARLIYEIWMDGFCAHNSGKRLPRISATKEWLQQPKEVQ